MMRLICIIKFVPDVDNFKYDYENNVLIRENVRLTLNPDDACAVAFALKVKAKDPETHIEVVTMAPISVKPHMEDLLRLGVDTGTIISDRLYVGSDTYATSLVLGRYLSSQTYDVILSGTHAIDGDTSHIPAQLGDLLGLNQMSGIIKVDETALSKTSAVFEVETEDMIATYEMMLPAILSLTRESSYKLPYIKRQDMDLDVTNRLNIISNEHLGFEVDEVGIKGSPTKVAKTYTKEFDQKERTVIGTDDEGITLVYEFLKEKGFI
ncbi:Electron transfer flavoprotein subunit beta/FixA family protein [Petrocella atlantisensis]|uniref:Electron transfer flavoprotein small subunit n=1 Tax=Petrocella atlantisensis TaxID=2173034 RepID=A0A3P7PXJ6_9FIRM|nr:electron transfer flavoprotein subunit beta/FixA family protein [Petrocella atlantisensis]VDN47921.1 Electron transfer flavoprotein subunit beta/FixA family protein [Petrocella atlantisensis]